MRFLFLISALISALTSLAQASNYQSLAIDKTLTANADAVIRLDHMNIQLKSHKLMTYTVRQVVTVLNKQGRQHARDGRRFFAIY